MTRIHIEGMTGSGKSFLIKYLKTRYPYFSIHTMLETNNVSNILDLNITKSRWAFFTEMDFLQKHINNIKKSKTDTLCFVENSIFSAKTCYFEYLRREHFFTDEEISLYNAWFKIMISEHPNILPDCILYIESDIHIHFERIINNSKSEQSNINLQTLQKFKYLYDKYLHIMEHHYHVRVVRVQCPPYFEDNMGDMEQVVQTIFTQLGIEL